MKHSRFLFLAVALLANLLAGPAARAQTPEWIWFDKNPPADGEVRFFRKTFTVAGPVSKAFLTTAADDEVTFYLNGKRVAGSRAWQRPAFVDLSGKLKTGENVLAAECRNEGGEAAFIARLSITPANGDTQTVVTDTSWRSSAKREADFAKPEFADAAWTPAVSKGKLGDEPWGDIMSPRQATPADALATLPGFQVELVRSAGPEEGSWVAMTIDDKGRLIISPQEGVNNILRLTLAGGKVEKVENINLPVGGAMGLLYADGDLYVNGQGKGGLALYRLRDTNNDDQYDTVEVLRQWKGDGGEHGPHGVVLGPDNHLYVVCGNFVDVPDDRLPSSPHRNYADDLVLQRAEDGNGFGAGRKPPGGFVLRMDRDGKNGELFAAGQRNTYDIAFNPDGELFGFDSDMEWDWGAPWYRPIRINHIVSGGDYGFREGSGKWPIWYPDSLPTTLNIGIGSPTGVKFGTQAKFPVKYRQALYAMDWTYGRLIAVHLTPKGSTYEGASENFVAPKTLQSTGRKTPLNVTDLETGKDGAMYFTTGGRGTQSGLYRVTYTGTESTSSPAPVDLAAASARSLRKQLAAFHGHRDARAVEVAWPSLNSDDRWIRYAARLAIESQPIEEWRQRALDETKVNASLTALLALARLGGHDAQQPVIDSLGRLKDLDLTEAQKLEGLRVLEVLFARTGKPEADATGDIIDALSPAFPTESEPLNREISQLLIYLEAPGIVEKVMKRVAEAPTQEEQLFYITALRHVKTGWTMDLRRAYFGWFNQSRARLAHTDDTMKWFADAGRDYSDGASLGNFLKHLRSDAVATLTDNEKGELALVILGKTPAPAPVAEPRKFVHEWKGDELTPALDQVSRGRSFTKGRRAFIDAQCMACHRFGNEGGAVGPDLTAVASRFSRADILSSILEPSKVVSEQYQNTILTKKDGDDVIGRVVDENDLRVVVVTNPLTGDKAEVSKAQIAKRVPSKVSPMPEGLVNVLSKEEVLDLLAYLESAGKESAAAFK